MEDNVREIQIEVFGPFRLFVSKRDDHGSMKSVPTNQVVVSLNEPDGNRGCLIYVNEILANDIAIAKQGLILERPISMDFFKSFIDNCGAKIKKVVINELKDDIFYALVYFDCGSMKFALDARPSDAITLALRSNCGIFIKEELLSDEKFINPATVNIIPEDSQISGPSEGQSQEEWFLNLDPDKIPKE